MKLLLIGPLPPPIGGTRISFNYLIRENVKFFESLSKFSFINLEVNSKSRVRNLFLQFLILTKILLRARKYDIVSLHANSKRVIIFAVVFKFLIPKKIKFIYRFFGGDLDYYLYHPLYRTLIKFSLSNTTILVQTKKLEKLLNSIDILNCKIRWFPTSRPVWNIKKSPNNNSFGKFKIFFAGHIKQEKGVKLLIDSCEKLINENYNLELVLAGRIIEKSIFSKLMSKKFIKYHGEVTTKIVSEQISESDIIIYPSYWSGEGYPGFLVESINVGKPIITTDFKYLGELVSDNGILIKPQCLTSLYQSLKTILDDSELYNRISRAAVAKKNLFDSSRWNGEFFQKILKEEYVRNNR